MVVAAISLKLKVAVLPSKELATAAEIFTIKNPGALFFLRYIPPLTWVAILLGKSAETKSKPVAPLELAARIFAAGDAGFAFIARLPPAPMVGIPALEPSTTTTTFPFTSRLA